MPEETVLVRDVKAIKTRAGNTRFVVTDDQGREFSTFKKDIARGLRRARRSSSRHEVPTGDRGQGRD
jgi:hypothetical protein